MKKFTVFLCSVFLVFGLATNVQALPFDFGFFKLENNTTLPGTQFSGELTEAGTNQVNFTISNVGDSDSTIFTVYFDDPMTLLDSFFIAFGGPSDVVLFEGSENSGNLPGGQNAIPPFPNPADGWWTASVVPPMVWTRMSN